MADFGFGEVKNTGRIDTEKLVKSYRNYLKETSQIIFEEFNYDSIDF